MHWLFTFFFLMKMIILLFLYGIGIRVIMTIILRVWMTRLRMRFLLISFDFWSHEFAFDFFKVFNAIDVKKLLLVDFLFALIRQFVETIKIDLSNKRWIVLMFKIFWKYNLSKLSDVLYSETSSFFLVTYKLLILSTL